MKKNDRLDRDHKDNPLSRKREKALIYRWGILVSILTLYILDCCKLPYKFFIAAFAVAILYNFAITYKSLRVKQLKKNTNYLILQLDAVVVSAFAALLGGMDSELYIVYFFMIAYCALYDIGRRTAVISVLSAALFSTAAAVNARVFGVNINCGILLLKDCFILFFAYGISLINRENRKIDKMHKKEYVDARIDKLTGLANRRYFIQKLKDENKRAETSDCALNVLMFDIDNFKQFNDSYGHLIGDELLTLFADIIKQNIRKTDVPVRYGGEEFLILIRDLDLNTAVTVAERICSQLEAQKIRFCSGDTETVVTASCGVARYPDHSGDIYKVVEYADEALYYAKNSGKNKVATFNQINK